jgi:hypothetical protein
VVAFGVAVAMLNLGLAVALETVLPQWRDPDAGWKFSAVRKVTLGQPRVIAAGSSRTQMGLAPVGLSSDVPIIFNWGLPGAGPFHHRLAFARWNRANLQPDALLVEILPAALGSPAQAETFIRKHPGRYSLQDIRDMEPDFGQTEGLRKEWFLQRMNPWHEQRLIIMSHVLPGFLPWTMRQDYRWRGTDAYGWLARPLDDSNWEQRMARTRADYEPSLKTLTPHAAPMNALRALAIDCRAKGIPVAFYLMPESPAFRSWYGPGIQANVRTAVKALCAETGAALLDAWDWMGEADFADGHHLTKAGAQEFSQRFYTELYGPWYRSVTTPSAGE